MNDQVNSCMSQVCCDELCTQYAATVMCHFKNKIHLMSNLALILISEINILKNVDLLKKNRYFKTNRVLDMKKNAIGLYDVTNNFNPPFSL